MSALTSKKDLVRFFCLDCNTIIESITRTEAEEAKMIGKQVERAGDRVKHTAARLVKDHVLSAAETRQVLHHFYKFAESACHRPQEQFLTSELHKMLADSVDSVVIHRPQPQANVAFVETVAFAPTAGTGYAKDIPIVDL